MNEITYGEKLFAFMGEELSSWNLEANELGTAVMFSFWLVDIFHFRMFLHGQVAGVYTYNLTVRFVPSWLPGAAFR